MTNEKYGIEKTRQGFALVVNLIESTRKAKENDGIVNLKDPSDLGLYFQAFPLIIPFFAGVENIRFEAIDYSEEELSSLKEEFGQVVESEIFWKIFKGLAMTANGINEAIESRLKSKV